MINSKIEMPRGNALLVGVGGSGKQSLSRLSAFISGLDVFQIQLRKGGNFKELKLEKFSQTDFDKIFGEVNNMLLNMQ